MTASSSRRLSSESYEGARHRPDPQKAEFSQARSRISECGSVQRASGSQAWTLGVKQTSQMQLRMRVGRLNFHTGSNWDVCLTLGSRAAADGATSGPHRLRTR